MADLKYKRVLLKISGEALLGGGGHNIDPQVVAGAGEIDSRADRAGDAEGDAVADGLRGERIAEVIAGSRRGFAAVGVERVVRLETGGDLGERVGNGQQEDREQGEGGPGGGGAHR